MKKNIKILVVILLFIFGFSLLYGYKILYKNNNNLIKKQSNKLENNKEKKNDKKDILREEKVEEPENNEDVAGSKAEENKKDESLTKRNEQTSNKGSKEVKHENDNHKTSNNDNKNNSLKPNKPNTNNNDNNNSKPKPNEDQKPPKVDNQKPTPPKIDPPAPKPPKIDPPKPKPDIKPLKKEIAPGKATKVVYKKDGQDLTILWTKGITPPNVNTDFRRIVHNNYDYLVASYIPNKGWYDINKNDNSTLRDDLLCSGAVASNMLHWWLDQNKNYIDRFLRENPERAFLPGERNFWKDVKNYRNSFKNQYNSTIFDMFKLYYGNTFNSLWSDNSADFFINGYTIHPNGYVNTPNFFKRDQRGGFFYEVFKDNILTSRKFSGPLNSLSNTVMTELQKGNIMGIEHNVASNIFSHIISIWGAEFDEQANLVALYISDSDDQYETNVGMKRYRLSTKNGKPAITTSNERESGSNLLYIHTLSLGQDKWAQFFK